MNHEAALARESRVYLQQALHLIEQLNDEQYGQTQPPVFTSGTGSHLRHVIEYYQCFFRGLSTGRIDYESRARDIRIETNRDHAASVVQGLIEQIRSLPPSELQRRLPVRIENGDAPKPAWCDTTVGRELDFLLSHTVHHLAIIAFMLRSLGTDPGEELGMAPATLRHVRQSTSCAP